jgi:hypothetical protein
VTTLLLGLLRRHVAFGIEGVRPADHNSFNQTSSRSVLFLLSFLHVYHFLQAEVFHLRPVKQTVDTTSDDYIDIETTRDQREHGRHRRATELPQAVPRGRSIPEDTKKDGKKSQKTGSIPNSLLATQPLRHRRHHQRRTSLKNQKEKKPSLDYCCDASSKGE